MTTDSDVADVLQLERELQTAECRRDQARVMALLAEDFEEVGASGRVWDLASALAGGSCITRARCCPELVAGAWQVMFALPGLVSRCWNRAGYAACRW
jgi:hypothetical protein